MKFRVIKRYGRLALECYRNGDTWDLLQLVPQDHEQIVGAIMADETEIDVDLVLDDEDCEDDVLSVEYGDKLLFYTDMGLEKLMARVLNADTFEWPRTVKELCRTGLLTGAAHFISSGVSVIHCTVFDEGAFHYGWYQVTADSGIGVFLIQSRFSTGRAVEKGLSGEEGEVLEFKGWLYGGPDDE